MKEHLPSILLIVIGCIGLTILRFGYLDTSRSAGITISGIDIISESDMTQDMKITDEGIKILDADQISIISDTLSRKF